MPLRNSMKKIIIYIIFSALVTPTLASLLGINDICAINENRNKIGFPDMETLKDRGFESVNEWYNDNFGLRDFLIRLQHQIDYTIFNYSKNLFFSSDHEQKYLFYRSVVAEEQIYNEYMSEETQEKILLNCMRIKDLLETQGISFKFFIAPQKNEVLPDNLPDIPICRNEKNMYFVMQEKFEAELADNYVNVIEELTRRNEKVPTYYYSDFHWNDWGAACAFGEVIKSYSYDIGVEMPYNVDELEVSSFIPDPNSAQLASLSVLWYRIPSEYTVDCPWEINAQEVQDENGKFQIWGNSRTSVFEGAVLFIGDSYTPPALMPQNGTSSGIVDLFEKTYFCHWDNAAGVLQSIPSDVKLVVIESIESHYFYLDKKLETLF